MQVIDDDGDLFGAINIIDALVVLLLLTVAVAGAALIFQSDSEPEGPTLTTTNVTLDLGSRPAYIASAINEGDTYTAGANSQLTITDVHLTPDGGQSRVILRAEIQGVQNGGGITYANAPPRLGRTLTIETNRYKTSGKIRAVGPNKSLDIDTTTVVLQATMASAEVRQVAQGDEILLAGRKVATVQDVAAYATNDPTERVVFVEATLQTYRQHGERRFGGVPIIRGQTVSLSKDGYTLNGRIERVGGGLERSNADILLEDIVDSETTARIAEGDVATVAGHDIAEITSVTTYATQNPDRKRVFVGVSLQTVEYSERPRFGTAAVQRGRQITIGLDDYRLSGSIERVGTLEQRGAVSTRNVTLRMSDVRNNMAEAIQPGMEERADGKTIARVTAVDTEPSLIITTGDDGSVNVVDHPFLRQVTIHSKLRVRQTTNGVQFKGQSLRQGSQVVLDLGTIVVTAEVVSIGA